MRILTIIGTRPEAVKMAPVIKQLAKSENLENFVCSTGQHREMLTQMLDLFDIRPDIELDIMKPNQTPTYVAARVLEKLDDVLADLEPDWVLAQGDTTTTMAATIAAHYRRVKVAHVEAGLRTYDRANPFPEEMNRVIADHASDLHFAPTERAKANLVREGISTDSIYVTGNTVIDALFYVANRPAPPELEIYGGAKRLIFVTAHRRENHGQPLINICNALAELAACRDDVHVVYAVHRNPNVREVVYELLANHEGISLVPPLDYLPMVHMMNRSFLILTDSGGVQEEAPALGKPVLVLRETTERPEAIEAGVARLVGTDSETIVGEAGRLLDDKTLYEQMSRAVNPFGDGRAAERIVARLTGIDPAGGLLEWGT